MNCVILSNHHNMHNVPNTHADWEWENYLMQMFTWSKHGCDYAVINNNTN